MPSVQLPMLAVVFKAKEEYHVKRQGCLLPLLGALADSTPVVLNDVRQGGTRCDG